MLCKEMKLSTFTPDRNEFLSLRSEEVQTFHYVAFLTQYENALLAPELVNEVYNQTELAWGQWWALNWFID